MVASAVTRCGGGRGASRRRSTRLAAIVAGLAVFTMAGQARQAAGQDRPTFRGGISIVEVSAVVTGDGNRAITDLGVADFEVLEDGARRPIVSVRHLTTAGAASGGAAVPAALAGARLDVIASNHGLADAPAFVLLLDDLNVSPYDAHRAIRAGLGVLGAMPADALVSVVTTSGEGGSLITLARPSQAHVARVRAFRGQFLLTGPPPNAYAPQTTSSSVDAPCGVGSAVENSPDCSDPTRATRRAGALEAIGRLLSRTGSRRKVLLWLTTDMGVSPLDPKGNQQAQFAALQRLLGGDVTVYAIDPRENDAPIPGPSGQPSSMGRPDGRAGGRMRVGTADTTFQGRGGSTMALGTDDMVGVPLTQIARDTGGRWIQNANEVEKIAAEIVTQNLSAYVIAYETAVGAIPGRHRVEVKVTRRDAKVSSRRAFVVAPEGPTAAAVAPMSDTTARLSDIVRGGVPFGQLALQAQVAPQFAADGPTRALVTVAVQPGTAGTSERIDLLVLAASDSGDVSAMERLVMPRPPAGVRWEGSVTLRVPPGRHQVRVAAITDDAARSGLLIEDVDVQTPDGDLRLGVPVLLASDPRGVRPTLARRFVVGDPLAFQVELAGQAVTRGAVSLRARLVDASGQDVQVREAVFEAAPPRTAQQRATGVVPTAAMAPGEYALLLEASTDPSAAPVRHVIPLRLEARGPDSPGAAGAAAHDAAATGRLLTPRAVAHGPLTRDARRGAFVMRTAEEWRAFWRQLPTRQAAPDIDFDRVVLLAVISDDESPVPAVPRIAAVRTEPGGLLVEWTSAAAPHAAAAAPTRPFVVVGLTDVAGHVRFERVAR